MLPKEKLKKLYKSGLSIIAIAEKMGWPYYTVRYWMERYNIEKRPRDEACYYGYWYRRNNGKFIPPYKQGRKLILKEVENLYYKKGHSARQVGELFGRSTSRVYDLMRRYRLSRRTSAETNNIAYLRQKPSFVLKKNLTAKEEKLKIAGVMLYWAEGTKKTHSYKGQSRGSSIDFANSDSEMIKLFLKFLRKICGVNENRLRVYLYCYANQNINFLKKYWHEVTGIPLKQFIKPYIRKDFLPEKIGKMKYGLVHVRYSDKKLFLQIKDWIQQYLNKNL